MTKSGKKVDKVTLITIAVVAILIITFVAGFIWGLGNVLAMEGQMIPNEVEKSNIEPPENPQQATELLYSSLSNAVEEKPRFERKTDYELNGDTLNADGSELLKNTLDYISEDFVTFLEDNSKKASADYTEGFEKDLRIPVITEDSIEEYICEYKYYQCPSCLEEAEEYSDHCELCGGENPYYEKFRDEYTITLTLNNNQQIINDNFNTVNGEDVQALAGDKAKGVFSIDNGKIDYNNPQIIFSVNRFTGGITHLEYKCEAAFCSNMTFEGEYSKFGSSKVSFTMAKSDIFDFTWPSVVLSEEKMTIEPGKKDNLLATLTCSDPAGQEITWKSSDENVVTVDSEGYMKAGKEAGEAVVTVYMEFEGKTYSDSCRIFVRYSVESLKLSERKINLKSGETYTLVPKISPKKATVQTVTWYSEDESIATVDQNGVVTAKKAGTVKVYALSDDEYYKSSCEVRVK